MLILFVIWVNNEIKYVYSVFPYSLTMLKQAIMAHVSFWSSAEVKTLIDQIKNKI